MPALSFFDLLSSIKIHNIYSSPIIFSTRSPHGGLQQFLIHLSEGLTYNHNTSSLVKKALPQEADAHPMVGCPPLTWWLLCGREEG